MDDGVTFGESEAFDWVHRHQLMTQGQVALFATDAQALSEASRAALSVVVRTGSVDEQRLAVAALRCRGCSVFQAGKGFAIGGPTLRVNIFRGSSEVLVPAAASLRIADLLADVPTREIKLGARISGSWPVAQQAFRRPFEVIMLATDLWLNVTPSAGSAVEQGIAPQVSLLSSGITCGHPLARPLDGPQADRRALMIAYARRVGGVPVLFALRSVAVNRG